MKNLGKYLALVFMILCSVQSARAADSHTVDLPNLDIKATNAFFYVPLANSKSTMAFFTITNNSNNDVSIVGVSSAAAKRIQLMPESSLLVPAHQSVALKASGRYLQINDLKGRLTTGDELHLEVSLSNGQKLILIARAKSAYDQTHGH